MSAMTALIMAGGTGGHVYPALAVAQKLLAQGWRVEWVGGELGLENRIVREAGIPLHRLPVRGLRGKGLSARLAAVWRLLKSMTASIAMLRQVKPDVVLGMGGYAAAPAGLMAGLLRVPLVIHEQNAVAGTTNRLLAPFAGKILAGLAGSFDGNAKAEVIGNPVREQIVAVGAEGYEVPAEFSAARRMKLLVLGGSLGSAPLNERVPEAVTALSGTEIASSLIVFHQCGDKHVEATERAYAACDEINVTVKPYIEDMAEAYRWADLVICRAGALTVSELAATGRPSILVPLPHAIDDHQTRNAESLSNVGAATLLRQADMNLQVLAGLIRELHDEPAKMNVMAKAALNNAKPNATDTVARVMKEVAHA